ncbi:MAG: flagellar biosynthetic protein FliO [Treponema sp.]|nr:flagellar biosynthetic protein FliO [Treponema sp.]
MFLGVRVLALAALTAAGLSLNIPQLSAQQAPGSGAEGDISVSGELSDPIESAERSLVFGDAGTGNIPAPVSSISLILRMVLVLALVAAAVYGVIFFIKRASRRSDVKDPFLKVLAGAHLGFNRYVHVVAVGSRAWLVGAAEGGVSLVAEIDDKDILNAMFLDDSRKSAERGTGPLPDFSALIRRLGIPADNSAPDAESVRRRRDRIKGL